MNLYNITIWDPSKGKEGEAVHLSVVADTDTAALRFAQKHPGEITNFRLAQTGVVVV